MLGKYIKESDFITTVGWLPIQEMMEFAIVKCTYSALNDPKWPKYLPIKFQEIKCTTRLENEMMVKRGEKTHSVIKHMMYLTIYQKQQE